MYCTAESLEWAGMSSLSEFPIPLNDLNPIQWHTNARFLGTTSLPSNRISIGSTIFAQLKAVPITQLLCATCVRKGDCKQWGPINRSTCVSWYPQLTHRIMQEQSFSAQMSLLMANSALCQ